VQLAAALVSRHVGQGHVCLPLADLVCGEIALGEDIERGSIAWPELDAWLAAIRASALCGAEPGETTPLVLDSQGRLYLRRYFERERTLASEIKRRANEARAVDEAHLAARLHHYFGDEPGDLQRSAAALAMRRGFSVISGGPGTGKTSTVVKIVALAIEEAIERGETPPRIALMAPTGKAAVRLESAIRSAKQLLVCDPRVLERIPESASTIHRALRARTRESPRSAPAPLRIDLLLVDEASMVDLELMTVILLGDRDQLASVEAGAVLGDICGLGRAETNSSLSASVIQLTRSYRYAADSGIGELARAIQAGDVDRTLRVLADGAYPDVRLCDASDPAAEFEGSIVAGYAPALQAIAEPARALALFDRFRVLCAHRRGEHGVEAMNRAIVRILFERGLIERADGQFIGRALLVTENDYRNQLWNGDVGIVARSERGERVACFVSTDGQTRELGFGRLPPHESAFALSVHKSQGSEVDEVALVLPREPSRVLTRELLYTAVTRARRRVVIHGTREVVAWAVAHAVARSTGLRELLD
jgi:exodeoxyribonuclease V alpha subunit